MAVGGGDGAGQGCSRVVSLSMFTNERTSASRKANRGVGTAGCFSYMCIGVLWHKMMPWAIHADGIQEVLCYPFLCRNSRPIVGCKRV